MEKNGTKFTIAEYNTVHSIHHIEVWLMKHFLCFWSSLELAAYVVAFVVTKNYYVWIAEELSAAIPDHLFNYTFIFFLSLSFSLWMNWKRSPVKYSHFCRTVCWMKLNLVSVRKTTFHSFDACACLCTQNYANEDTSLQLNSVSQFVSLCIKMNSAFYLFLALV